MVLGIRTAIAFNPIERELEKPDRSLTLNATFATTRTKTRRDVRPPTITPSVNNVLVAGGTSHLLSVIYRDAGGLNLASLRRSHLRVLSPNGTPLTLTRTGIRLNPAGTRAIVTFQINAIGGSWDSTDNGTYTLSIRGRRVSDRSRNFVKAGRLTTFQVAIPASPNPPGSPSPPEPPIPPIPPGGDAIAPTASSPLIQQINSSSGFALFTVTYSDNVAIDVTSLGANDLQVTGTGGFNQTATLVSVNGGSGTPRIVTYRITAPSGSWNVADNGIYTVSVLPNQVKDIAGNFVAAGAIGSFQISIVEPASGSADNILVGSSSADLFIGSAGDDTINGNGGEDAIDYSQLSNGIHANLTTGRVLKPIYGGTSTPRIMPLGDSITHGLDNQYPGAYRIELFNNFVQDGFAIDFVGSQSNGPASGFDRNHEGYPGAAIRVSGNNLYDRITASSSILAANPADVILLMIGTNDTNVSNNRTAAQMIADLNSLIDEITARLPSAYLIVSTIPPVKNNNTRNQTIQSYNAALPTLINQKIAADLRVALVNAGGALVSSDIGGDNIHPTEAGHTKLGDIWYDEIAGRDVLTNVDHIIGTSFLDTIVGNTNRNVIQGSMGSDRLTGNGGTDTFVYNTASEGTDTITDFGGDDLIQIVASGFGSGLVSGVSLSTNASATGTLVNGNTPIGTGANFLLNGGTLFFDPDGTGAQAAVAIAALGVGSLAVNQIAIV